MPVTVGEFTGVQLRAVGSGGAAVVSALVAHAHPDMPLAEAPDEVCAAVSAWLRLSRVSLAKAESMLLNPPDGSSDDDLLVAVRRLSGHLGALEPSHTAEEVSRAALWASDYAMMTADASDPLHGC